MTSTSNVSPTPYCDTAKCKKEQERHQSTKERLNRMKGIMIAQGIETKINLKSQEKVLFAVVKWLTSEDLNEILEPLDLKGDEAQQLKNKKREQYKRDKLDLAYTKLREFIGGTIGKWKNVKGNLERLDVLRLILEHIEGNGSALSTGYTSSTSGSSTPTLNTSNTPQTNFPTPSATIVPPSPPQVTLPSFFPLRNLQNGIPPLHMFRPIVPIVPVMPAYIQLVSNMMAINNNIRMNHSNGFMVNDLIEVEDDKENQRKGTIDVTESSTPKKIKEDEIDVIS